MDNQIDLGKLLIEYGVSSLDRTKFTLISYEKGIAVFDEGLSGIKFCNTNCISVISVFEKGVAFTLTLDNLNPIAFLIVKREDIVDFQVERDILVEVPKFNRFKAAFGGIVLAAGAVGGIIGTLTEIQKNKNLKFKVNESKVENGRRFVIRHKLSDGSINEIIYVASNDSNNALQLEHLLAKNWKTEYNPNVPVASKGCLPILILILIVLAVI